MLAGRRDVKSHLYEFHVPIYGRTSDELSTLASFVVSNQLHAANPSQCRYVLALDLQYALFRKRNEIDSLDQLLRNIFQPMFDATQSTAQKVNPGVDFFWLEPESYPALATFLKHVTGIRVSVSNDQHPSSAQYPSTQTDFFWYFCSLTFCDFYGPSFGPATSNRRFTTYCITCGPTCTLWITTVKALVTVSFFLFNFVEITLSSFAWFLNWHLSIAG